MWADHVYRVWSKVVGCGRAWQTRIFTRLVFYRIKYWKQKKILTLIYCLQFNWIKDTSTDLCWTFDQALARRTPLPGRAGRRGVSSQRRPFSSKLRRKHKTSILLPKVVCFVLFEARLFSHTLKSTRRDDSPTFIWLLSLAISASWVNHTGNTWLRCRWACAAATWLWRRSTPRRPRRGGSFLPALLNHQWCYAK